MNIAVCSMFNNSIARGDLFRYHRQIDALAWPEGSLRLYLAEGDSEDLTWPELRRWQAQDHRVNLLKLDMGVPVKGSVTDPDRLLHGNIVGSAVRNMALADGWADRILWIESDLIWGPELLQRLTDNDFDYVAPWIPIQAHGDGTTDIARLRALPAEQVIFYDIWAFRSDAEQGYGFDERRPEAPYRLYSAGSCLLGKHEVVARSNYPTERAIVGWCEQAHKAGYQVWCDPRVDVWHKAG